MKERLPVMLAILLIAGLGQANAQDKKPTLILNEDDSHFFGSRAAEQMNLEGLHAFVDQYANTAVSFTDLGGAAAPPYQCAVGTRCRASPSSRHETTAGNLPQFPHLLVRRALDLDEPALSAEEEALVEQRLAEHRRNPESALSRAEMKARLRGRFAA